MQPGKIFYPFFILIALCSTFSALSQPVHRNFAAAETNVLYQEMHVIIDPAINRVDGIITYIFSSKVDQLSRFVVDYADELPIHFIRRGNEDLPYTHADDLINIDLGKILQAGGQDTIMISFSSEGTLRQ